MPVSDKTHKRITLAAALVTMSTAGFLLYERWHKTQVGADQSLITALTTSIPVFEISNVGGSQAVGGLVGANPIGNSSPNDTPMHGFGMYTGPLEGPGSSTLLQQEPGYVASLGEIEPNQYAPANTRLG